MPPTASVRSAGLRFTLPPLLPSSEICRDGRLRDAERARQRGLREVVRVERGDVRVRRGGDRLLRLRDFEVAGDTGGEAVARLLQLLLASCTLVCDACELLVCGAEVEQRRADFEFDAAREIGELRFALPRAARSASMRRAVVRPPSKIGTRTFAASV